MPGAEVAAQAWARITVPHIAQRPVMRRSPDGGQSFPRCSRSGYRYEVAIKTALPSRPTTVPTIDYWAAPPSGRILVVDLDTAKVPPRHAADRAGYVAGVSDQIVGMVAECGGNALVVVSPSGGRHVYVLFADLMPHPELRRVLRALQKRFGKVVDTQPMEGTDGQIRGPGSPHKSENGQMTGFMELTVSVEEAEAICQARNGPGVWEGLLVELAAELDALAGGLDGRRGERGRVWEAEHPAAPPAPLDTRYEPYLPRLGGRTGRIREDLERTARTGQFDPDRYASRSEARQGVLSSAAARGWRLAQVRAALRSEWAAIASWWRDEALLLAEWDKAIRYAARLDIAQLDAVPAPPIMPSGQKVGDPVQQSPTRGEEITPPGGQTDPSHAPPAPVTASAPTDPTPLQCKDLGLWGLEVRPKAWSCNTYQEIRVWQQAMRIVERLLELEWGERALSRRAVLRAIGAAAQMTGSLTIEFGCRSLAYATGLDNTTVAKALRELREGPYALIDLVREAQGTRGDTYALVVPDAVAAEAHWRRWRPGRIEAIHPAFRELGKVAAFAYEVLSSAEMSTAEVETAGLLARSSTYEALETLAAHGLAVRGPGGGWIRGDADLDDVADRIGATELADAHLKRIQAERETWHEWLGIIAVFADAPGVDGKVDGDHALGDLLPASTGAGFPAEFQGQASPAAAAQVPGQRRPAASPPAGGRERRRRAPEWLRPPSRQRPISDADISWDAEALAVLAELAHERRFPPPQTWPPALPAKVAAAVAADLAAAAADDEQLALERADYEAQLAELRAAAHLHEHDLPEHRQQEAEPSGPVNPRQQGTALLF